MSYLELLKLAAPESIVVITALALLIADLVALREIEAGFRRIIGGMIACVGCVGAIVWLMISAIHGNAGGGMFVADPLTQLVKIALLALTIFTVLLSIESDFTPHAGEYLALVLMAAVGMMFLVSAEDLLTIFLSLELVSLSLYILAAFNKRDVKSAEASLILNSAGLSSPAAARASTLICVSAHVPLNERPGPRRGRGWRARAAAPPGRARAARSPPART